MNMLKHLLILLLIGFSVQAHADKVLAYYDGIAITDRDIAELQQKMSLAKEKALQDILRFKQNPISNYYADSKVRLTLDAMYYGLLNAKIVGMEPKEVNEEKQQKCQGAHTAFSTDLDHLDKVYMCPYSIIQHETVNQLAEHLIHESYHLQEGIMGIRDDNATSEGFAVSYEYAIVRNSNDKDCVYNVSGYEMNRGVKNFLKEHRVTTPSLCERQRRFARAKIKLADK